MGDLAGSFEGFVGSLGWDEPPRRPSGDDGDDDYEAWLEQLSDVGQALEWLEGQDTEPPFEDVGECPPGFWGVIDEWLSNGVVTDHPNLKLFGYSVVGEVMTLGACWVEGDRLVYATFVDGPFGRDESWMDLAEQRCWQYLHSVTNGGWRGELVRHQNKDD